WLILCTRGRGGRALTSTAAHGIDSPALLSWFDRAGRPLPWRGEGVSAWEILLCEVMSQQTPVARVEPVWRAWLERWPGPAELADLLSLPGVGDYTARAVACFAHGQAVPVVDTNVRRVVARAVNGVAEAGPPSNRRDLAAVEALLPARRAEAVAFSVAIMEL